MRQNWNEIIALSLEEERQQYAKTEAGQYRRKLDLQMHEMLETNLTHDQKNMVDEVMFARCVALEKDGERFYQKGMKDAIWLLKKLGVIDMEE